MDNFEKIAEKYGKNAIGFKFTRKKAEPLQTKIGGKPDLPPDFEWYYYEGTDYNDVKANRPLSFIAQVNCEEIRKYDKDNLLPEKGMLYFFYELMTMEWGFSPEDKGCAKVFYYDGDLSELKPSEFPEELEEECIIPEIAVEFQSFRDIPDYCETQLLDDFEIPDDDDEFDEFIDEYSDRRFEEFDNDERIKLLGYADTIQNIMQYECEYVSRGYEMGEGLPEISESEKADIQKHLHDWILLFQMDTIEKDDYELMFGDCGRIYFWIRKEDLEKRNFSNVHLVLQCY